MLTSPRFHTTGLIGYLRDRPVLVPLQTAAHRSPASCRRTTFAPLGAERVASVANGRDHYGPGGVIDEVEHSVVAASCRPGWIEWWVQRLTDPSWVVEQRAGDEGIRGRGHLGEKPLGERPRRWSSDPEPVPLINHRLAGRCPARRIISASSFWSRLSPCSSALMASK